MAHGETARHNAGDNRPQQKRREVEVSTLYERLRDKLRGRVDPYELARIIDEDRRER